MNYAYKPSVFEVSTDSQDTGRAAVLLHGYQQSGAKIGELLGESLRSDFDRILCPDAPFPVPFRARDEWRMGYSWYFFDREKSLYFIEMDVAVDALSHWISNLATESPSEIWVIGYSQGGYLAPFVAQACHNVRTVVGINSRFRDELLPGNEGYQLHGVHANGDELVDCDRSRACFQRLQQKGQEGSWSEYDGGHRLSPEAIRALKALF